MDLVKVFEGKSVWNICTFLKSGIDIDQGAVIIGDNGTIWKTFTVTLSTSGIILSIIALFLLLLTAFRFAEWRQNYKNQLLIQLMIARFVYTMTRYSIDILDAFAPLDCHIRKYIYARVFFLFYSELAMLFWMFVFTRQMYKCLVKVFDVSEDNILRISFITWFLPLVVTTFFVYLPFKIRPEYMQWYTIALISVKWPLMIANAILLILIIKSIIVDNKNNKQRNVRLILVMICMIVTLSLQHLILDISNILIFAYTELSGHFPDGWFYGTVAYNIFLLYVCAFTIFFWLFGNVQTRRLWREGSQVKHRVISSGLSLNPGPIVSSRPMSAPVTRVSKHPIFQKQFSVL